MLDLKGKRVSAKGTVGAEGINTATAPYGVWRAWYALIVFEVMVLAEGIDLAIVTLLVHPIEIDLHINDIGFAAIAAIPVTIGLAAAYYPAGLLADTFPRRYLIVAGSCIWAAGALIAATADSAVILFIARLMAGIGTALPATASLSLLGDAFPPVRRAFAMSTYAAGYSVGTGVGLTICGALVAWAQRNGTFHVNGMAFLPWQQCFVAIATMGIVILALVLTVSEPPRVERSKFIPSNIKSSLCSFAQYLQRHWALWTLLLIGYPIGLTAYCAVGTWGPAFGMRHYGITGVPSIALLGAFSAGGSLLGSVMGGLLAQRGINRGNPDVVPRMLTVVSAICCASMFAIQYMPSWLFAVMAIGIVAAASIALWVLILIAIQETAPNEVRGQLLGVNGFITFIPGILGSTVVALLASHVFAKTGGLGSAMAVVGGTASGITTLLFAVSGRFYKRAARELRTAIAPLRTQRGE